MALRQGGCSSDARAGLDSSRKSAVPNGSRLCDLSATSCLPGSGSSDNSLDIGVMPQKIHGVFGTRGCWINRLPFPGSGCGTQTLQETPPYLTVRRFKRAGSRTSRVQLGVTRCEGVAVQTSQISVVLWFRKQTGRRQVAVSFNEAASVFDDPLAMTYGDLDHYEGEDRFITFGDSANGRLLVVSHTDRDDRTRIISARQATRKERTSHENG